MGVKVGGEIRSMLGKSVRLGGTISANVMCGGRGVPGDSVEEMRARRWGGWDGGREGRERRSSG